LLKLLFIDKHAAEVADEGPRQTLVFERDADRLRTGKAVQNPKADLPIGAPTFDPPSRPAASLAVSFIST
jgi:hypothetical protein